MDEKEMYGEDNAIDTEFERSILEYRPKVKYEPKKPITVNLQTEEVVLDEEEDDEDVDSNDYEAEEKPAQQYQDFAETYDLLNQMIEYVEEKIKDTVVPLSAEQVEKIYESFPHLDPSLLSNGVIDFQTYANTFEDPEAPANSLIQDIVHSYAEDVDGSLELELYEDLKELQATVREGYFLYKQSILKNYIDGELPDEPVKNEELVKQIDEAVQQQNDWFDDISKNYSDTEKKYYDTLRTAYGTPEFFKVTEEYTASKRPYDIAVRENKTIQEMILLVDNLLQGTEDTSARIKSGLVLGSDIDTEEVMKVLENQATTKEEFAELMKMTQLSLKLQVNYQIEDKKQYRDVLKNINNLSRKQRAHDELLTAFELRNKMYLKTYDALQNLNSPSKDLGVEAFLNQLAGGLNLIQEQYHAFVNDVYAMYTSDYEVRRDKIEKTLDKENARAGYSLVLDHL
ncbi:hypothetical protein COJ01_18235 [Priestia megaterium]|uniref:hypothetical protein n=1 Tax=Priestia megaterium TaxID=1404 RepID=UPI000BF303DD|nr:hypothetical protein [Priestia megaterium]PFK99980.1 hypothetical protein COJ01_18235 [Priestia megaterium]